MAWTAEDLIVSVKRIARIPTAQNAFATQDFLDIANEQLQSYIVPFVTSQREDYYIAHYDVLLAAGQIEYRLPTRAVGQALRRVVLINAQNQVVDFPRVSREDLEGANRGFYLDGNVLVIVTDDPSKVTQLGVILRMDFHQRPNKLVSSTAVGTIVNINSTTRVVTVQTAPATFTSSVLYDFVRGRPGFECLGVDLVASAVPPASAQFVNPIPTDLVVGDVVALAGESNYPQIPLEIHPLLAQRVAVKCLEAMGDEEHIQTAAGVLGRMEADAAKLLTPRVAGNVERIVNRGSVFRTFW